MSGRETPVVPARRRVSTWIALTLLGLSLAMLNFPWMAVLVPSWEAVPGRPDAAAEFMLLLAFSLATALLPVTGAFLAILRPHNLIGWLLLAGGISFGVTSLAPIYVEVSISLELALPAFQILDWLAPAFGGLAFVLLVVWIPLYFPDGRLPGPRWRAVVWATAVLTVAAFLLNSLAEDPELGRALPNPIDLGVTADAASETLGVLGFAQTVLMSLGVVSVLIRFRRSRGIERQQMKWFLAAVGLLAGSSLLAAVAWSTVAFMAFIAALAFLPIAIGIAVLRYRLYEIDRIISRTIGWAIVTGLLVGTLALLVLGSSAVLEPLTGGNTLAVAGSTLIVAALFAPLRGRVQRAVDRRFDRSRYDGEQLIAAFGERLRDEVDLETIRADVLATVDAAVRPAGVGLWLRGRPGDET